MKATIQMKKGREYSTFDKEFNDDRHLSNWMRLMERKGCKIIGVTPHQDMTREQVEAKSISDYIQAQENYYYDNFSRNNNC